MAALAKVFLRTTQRCHPLLWQLSHLRVNKSQMVAELDRQQHHRGRKLSCSAAVRLVAFQPLYLPMQPCARLSTEAHDRAHEPEIPAEPTNQSDWQDEEEDVRKDSRVGSPAGQGRVNEPVKSGSSWLTGGFQLGPDMFGGISDRKIADLARRIACSLKQRLEVEASDIKEEFMTGSGRGGQKINKTASKVRVTHVPTNLQATSQDERERSKNRFIALRTLVDKMEEAANPRKGDKARDKIRKQKARAKRQHRLKKDSIQAKDTDPSVEELVSSEAREQ